MALGGNDEGLADPPTSHAEMTPWLLCGAVSGWMGRSEPLQQEDGVSVAVVGVQSAYKPRCGMGMIPPQINNKNKSSLPPPAQA